MPDLSYTRVLIVIAYKDYQDHELKPVKHYLDMFGANVNIASSSLGTASGKFGGHEDVDYLVSDIHPENYNAIIFIGGPGAEEFKEDQITLGLIKGAYSHCDVLAAICIAPTILARAGVLEGKKATVWSSPDDQSAIEELILRKAKYVDKNVVIDGKLITANGPEAADEFARSIVDALA